MNKEDKKMQEMDDDTLEDVAGGYVVKWGNYYALRADGDGEDQGLFTNLDDLERQAERLGTSTQTRSITYLDKQRSGKTSR